MNYLEFSDIMNNRNLQPTERTVLTLCNQVKTLYTLAERQAEDISRLLKIIEGNTDRIGRLENDLFAMFPQTDIIDTMCEDNEEARKEMLCRYVNANPDYEQDTYRYKPEQMLAEIRQTNPELARAYELEYRDQGAIWLTRRYREWKHANDKGATFKPTLDT